MAKQKEGRGKLGEKISRKEGKVQGEKFHSRKVPSLLTQSPLTRRGRGLDGISKFQILRFTLAHLKCTEPFPCGFGALLTCFLALCFAFEVEIQFIFFFDFLIF